MKVFCAPDPSTPPGKEQLYMFYVLSPDGEQSQIVDRKPESHLEKIKTDAQAKLDLIAAYKAAVTAEA